MAICRHFQYNLLIQFPADRDIDASKMDVSMRLC